MTMAMLRVTVRLPTEMINRLEALRRCLNRDNPKLRASTSDLVRAALEAYIRQWQSLAWLQGNWKIAERKKDNGNDEKTAR